MSSHPSAKSTGCGFESTITAERQLDDLCDKACPDAEFDIQIERQPGSDPVAKIIGDSKTDDPVIRKLMEDVVKMISTGVVKIRPGIQYKCRLIFE